MANQRKNQDGLNRMRHLFLCSFLAATDGDTDSIHLSQFYGRVLLEVSRKLVVRMYIQNVIKYINLCRTPEVKRSFCKQCRVALIPGRTSKVRITSKPQKSNNCLTS